MSRHVAWAWDQARDTCQGPSDHVPLLMQCPACSASMDLVLLSPSNYFLYTPLLPSAATGTVEERSIVEPIRRIVNRKVGVAACITPPKGMQRLVSMYAGRPAVVIDAKFPYYKGAKMIPSHLAHTIFRPQHQPSAPLLQQQCCNGVPALGLQLLLR